MCGIAGLVGAAGVDRRVLDRMGAVIAHRGPDDHDIWIDESRQVGFAHRRLAIVDLSPTGHQPMQSRSGRYVLSYNGEIYNHRELRAELDRGAAEASGETIGWRGHSDTEVLLEYIERWGLDRALRCCVGMFAIALWDQRERRLHLARDRFGEKPLYYGWVGRDFVFASELKSIRQHPGFDNAICRKALSQFTARTYVPAPLTIYERLYKLLPGTILTLDPSLAPTPRSSPPGDDEPGTGISMRRYWSYASVVAAGLADPLHDEQEAIELLDGALAQSIGGQAVADVPVGAFLSGGIDSSTVVALYQRHSAGTIKTYSIGFEESGFDEARHAKAVAGHLGTDHHERYVSARDAQDVIPDLPSIYDEPFADPSQIPTYLVSRFARKDVTVALSGDGGDELFGGYNRHFQVPRLWSKARRVPRPIRTIAGGAAGALPPSLWNGLSRLRGSSRQPSFGTKVQKGLRAAGGARGVLDIYESFLDEWDGRSPALGAPPPAPANDLQELPPGMPDTVRMMYGDAVGYLPDDILCKVDRAAMAVSLETRVPFLDHRVAEVAARIPVEMKISGGKGKQILRKLLFRHVPKQFFDRPKAGFAIPVGEWVRGSLRDWAEDLLDPGHLAQTGYFDAEVVQQRWMRHLQGREDATHALWAVLMFEAWRRAQH